MAEKPVQNASAVDAGARQRFVDDEVMQLAGNPQSGDLDAIGHQGFSR